MELSIMSYSCYSILLLGYKQSLILLVIRTRYEMRTKCVLDNCESPS